jgi:hypothetical protein
MVSRTKISKEIRRRTGGVSQETGKGTSVEEINRDRHMWEMVPGTGTSPYNPPKWKKKKRASYTEEDLGQVGTIKNKAMREEARKQSRLARHKAPTAAMLLDYPQTPEKKSKGGIVKKAQGHKKKTRKIYGGHHGNKYVAKLYK